MKKIFLGLFCLAVIIECLGGFFDSSEIHLISKPMIMLMLGSYYVVASGADRSMIILLAVVFSLAGDILLLNPEYFIAGLVAFLIAHVLYIFAYRQHVDHEQSESSLRGIHRIRLAFPIVLAGMGLVVILFPFLGDLKIPVTVYAVVITSMVLTALFRYGKTKAASFWMVFAGAVCFMISDSILAINKFLLIVKASDLWIMLTYSVGQFLIIEGLLRHHESESRLNTDLIH
jgi:uncharacterized membrane protein YhhN